MRQTLAAASTLLTLCLAQGGPPGGFGPHDHGSYGPSNSIFSAFPSCMSSCWTKVQDQCNNNNWGPDCFCGSSAISTANSCIENSSCGEAEKSGSYQTIAQLCANAGKSVTASPEGTWSATSGGTNYPSTWTAQPSWTAAYASWATQTTGGRPDFGGWNGGNGWGPFGPNGAHNGWGPWASSASGAWTTGPWTSWWGGDACPGSTWSGWTSGPWGTSAPWTSWPGCTASTTASSVITTTVSSSGGQVVTTEVTSYGIEVAAKTGAGVVVQGSSSSSTGGAVAPMRTGSVIAGAAGMVGIVGGALLL